MVHFFVVKRCIWVYYGTDALKRGSGQVICGGVGRALSVGDQRMMLAGDCSRWGGSGWQAAGR